MCLLDWQSHLPCCSSPPTGEQKGKTLPSSHDSTSYLWCHFLWGHGPAAVVPLPFRGMQAIEVDPQSAGTNGNTARVEVKWIDSGPFEMGFHCRSPWMVTFSVPLSVSVLFNIRSFKYRIVREYLYECIVFVLRVNILFHFCIHSTETWGWNTTFFCIVVFCFLLVQGVWMCFLGWFLGTREGTAFILLCFAPRRGHNIPRQYLSIIWYIYIWMNTIRINQCLFRQTAEPWKNTTTLWEIDESYHFCKK